MRYVDEYGREIGVPDLTRGRLIDFETVHHEAIPATGRYEYRVNEAGGTQQTYVEETAYRPAYDEVVCQMYIPYTDAELAAMGLETQSSIRASELRAELRAKRMRRG